MLVLVAPLNWGLGHATRCIPLVRRFLSEGHRVVLGGDGDSLLLLRKHFPELTTIPLAPLRLRYGKGRSQVWAMLRALPQLICSSMQDHRALRRYRRQYGFDLVVSDNRFGLYTSRTRCVYITHQLYIRLPRGWRWLEPLAHALHACIYNRYDEVWVPDFEDETRSLSHALSHRKGQPAKGQKAKISFIGPLSRFEGMDAQAEDTRFRASVVAVLSGLEPQRTLLEQELIRRYRDSEEQVLIVQGLVGRPRTVVRHGNMTIVPSLSDNEMRGALLHAQHILARSGYSTIMDLAALGLLDRAELIPTPGQTEQQYLAHAIVEATYRRRDGRNG